MYMQPSAFYYSNKVMDILLTQLNSNETYHIIINVLMVIIR